MSRTTPELRDFAERLIAYETRKAKTGITTPAAFYVCEKLRPHLATLMGTTGFSALLSRALALAAAEAPALRAVRVQADGSLGSSEEARTPDAVQNLTKGSVVLLAQLFGLLEAFIGESLTLRILRDVWPKLTLTTLYFSKDDQK